MITTIYLYLAITIITIIAASYILGYAKGRQSKELEVIKNNNNLKRKYADNRNNSRKNKNYMNNAKNLSNKLNNGKY